MRERHGRRLGRQHPQCRRQLLRLLRRQPPLHPGRERSRAETEEPVALPLQPFRQPLRRLLRAPVLRQPACQLFGGLLRLELRELRLLVREEATRLQLEQRGDEDEELAACLELELVARGEPLDERNDNSGDVDVGQVELLAQDEREQQVEGPLEGVQIQLELAHDHVRQPSGTSGRLVNGRASSGSRSARSSIEPLTSARRIVMCLRSPSSERRELRIRSARCSGTRDRGAARAGSGARGVPHWLQNRLPGWLT